MDQPSSECSFIAYIDESGELGRSYDKGSSECLVMGAAILPAWRPNLPELIFEHARSLDRKPVTPFPKFQKCSEKRRWLLTMVPAFYHIGTVHVAIHKPTLFEAHIGQNMNACYAYLIKLTLERVSWWVRDNAHPFDPNGGHCHLVFSENSSLPYQSIKEYLQRLKDGRGIYNCRIDWRYVSPDDFAVEAHQAETGLHLADIAAGALYTAIDPTKKDHGITDDRYIRNLRPVIYRNDRKAHGVKIFPSEAEALLRERRLLEFLNSLS